MGGRAADHPFSSTPFREFATRPFFIREWSVIPVLIVRRKKKFTYACGMDWTTVEKGDLRLFPFFSIFVQKTNYLLTSKFIYRLKVSKVGNSSRNFTTFEKFDRPICNETVFSNRRKRDFYSSCSGWIFIYLRVGSRMDWILNFPLGKCSLEIWDFRPLCDQIYSSIIFESSFIYLLTRCVYVRRETDETKHAWCGVLTWNKEEKDWSIKKKLW